MGYLGFKFRISSIKKKADEETAIIKQLADFKLKTLHAQMNPHAHQVI